jgi:hypothetical protein
MTTRVGEAVAVIILVAWMPSMPGIRMSITTTSGTISAASRTASLPVPASPTTSMSSLSAMSRRNPERTSGWSSASTTLMLIRAGALLPGSRPRAVAPR